MEERSITVSDELLYPYQQEGVDFLLDKRRALLADEMGLGKTRQAIATIVRASALPALVVCPKSLSPGWRDEIRELAPTARVQVVNGSSLISQRADFTIINYDVVQKRLLGLLGLNIKALVLDESHYVKNEEAQRSQAVDALKLSLPSDCVMLCISGTPILSRPAELINQLKLIDRLDDVGGEDFFWEYYCAKDPRGAQNLTHLNEALRSSCMIRRLKRDVLKDLPPKTWINVPVELDNEPEYRHAEQQFLDWLADHVTADEEGRMKVERAARAEALVRLGVLRRLSAEGKIDGIVEWVDNFMALGESEGEKLVLFAHHQRVQQSLFERLSAYRPLRISSAVTDAEKRGEIVKTFQTDARRRLIVCSLQAAGVGLTLTAASDVAFAELGWTPAAMDQAADRCHRIGQKDAVMAWTLTAPNTIDQRLQELIDNKRAILEEALDPSEAEHLSKASVEDEVLDGLATLTTRR